MMRWGEEIDEERGDAKYGTDDEKQRVFARCLDMLGFSAEDIDQRYPSRFTLKKVIKAYRKAAIDFHPDKPTGSTEKMTELNLCKEILTLEAQKNEQKYGH